MNAYKYKKEFDAIAYEICRKFGNQRKIAKALKIHEHTITVWKANYPSFRQAIEKGKKDAYDI